MYEYKDMTSAQEVEQAIKEAMCDDFDLPNVEFYSRSFLPKGHQRRDQRMWYDQLLDSGISKEYVDFLTWVLDPNPHTRPSAQAILNHPLVGGEGSNLEGSNAEGSQMPSGILPVDSALDSSHGPSWNLPHWHSGTKAEPMAEIAEADDVYMRPMEHGRDTSSIGVTAAATPSEEPSKGEPPQERKQSVGQRMMAHVRKASSKSASSEEGTPHTQDEEKEEKPQSAASNFLKSILPTSNRGMKRAITHESVPGAREAPPPPLPSRQQEPAQAQAQRPSVHKTYSEASATGKSTGGLYNPGLLGMLQLDKNTQ